MKQSIFIQVKDPSGEERTLKFNQFPISLGTSFGDPQGLRDAQLSGEALWIEERKGMVLKSMQDGLLIQVGDFKFPAIQIPMEVPLQVGDTEITFFDHDPSREKTDFLIHDLTSKWFTRSFEGLQMLRELKKISATKLSIYLYGETGTGKEVLAEQIHQWSDRASGSFVAINCGALPLSLAESELFGHVKGSYTGASRDRVGAFLQAHNGTLFLDEVGDLPPELQVKLLRFLECGEIRPVGSDRVFHANVRVVCATHKPLQKLVEEGKFRQDLYFRLASVLMEIPPLRVRVGDIKELANRFAKENQKSISEKAMRKILACSWTGNVRELKHAITRACGVSRSGSVVLNEKDFDFLFQNNLGMDDVAEQVIHGICTIEEMEKVLLLRALKMSRGNRTNTAKLLGIARSTLFDMIKRYKIVGPKALEYRIEEETT